MVEALRTPIGSFGGSLKEVSAVKLATAVVKEVWQRSGLAGGTEGMSNVPHLVLNARWGKKMGDLQTVDALFHDGLHCVIEGYHMGITAENLVERYRISREDQDVFALESQEKAFKAKEQGKFQNEIIPIPIKTKQGTTLFTEDEHIKNTSLEKLKNLKPAFKEKGTVTAGNALD